MPDSAVWDTGHWDNCYWDVMYPGTETRSTYVMRGRRPLKRPPEDMFLLRHESDLKLFLYYLRLKLGEENVPPL